MREAPYNIVEDQFIHSHSTSLDYLRDSIIIFLQDLKLTPSKYGISRCILTFLMNKFTQNREILDV